MDGVGDMKVGGAKKTHQPEIENPATVGGTKQNTWGKEYKVYAGGEVTQKTLYRANGRL